MHKHNIYTANLLLQAFPEKLAEHDRIFLSAHKNEVYHLKKLAKVTQERDESLKREVAWVAKLDAVKAKLKKGRKNGGAVKAQIVALEVEVEHAKKAEESLLVRVDEDAKVWNHHPGQCTANCRCRCECLCHCRVILLLYGLRQY